MKASAIIAATSFPVMEPIMRPVLLSLLLLAAFPAPAQTVLACPPGTVPLQAISVRACAEIAQTEPQREYGLMHRTRLGTDAGMLFVFPEAQTQRFWMKNTALPLSIAFLDDNGTIVNIEDMQPQTLDVHASRLAVRYALEMELGWFARHHLKAGSQFRGLPASTDAR